MKLINFQNLATLAMLAITVAAIPGYPYGENEHTSFSSSFSSVETPPHTNHHPTDPDPRFRDYSPTDPDPRFKNISLAHPHAEVHTSNHKRDEEPVYGVYHCAGNYFSGDCQWQQLFDADKGRCINRPVKTPFGSIGPDKGVYCDLFEWEDCRIPNPQPRVYNFTWPGTGNCMEAWGNLDGPGLGVCPRSYKCDIHPTWGGWGQWVEK